MTPDDLGLWNNMRCDLQLFECSVIKEKLNVLFPFLGSCRRPLRAANRKTDSAFITPEPRITRSKKKTSKHKVTIVFSSDEENSLDEGENIFCLNLRYWTSQNVFVSLSFGETRMQEQFLY